MNSENSSLEGILERLHSAIQLLRLAEKQWPSALQAEMAGARECAKLEELLHCATHETGSTLGFFAQDIEALLAWARVRRVHALFTENEFDRIVRQGWSLQLVQELHEGHPTLSLPQLSAKVKELAGDASLLPRIRANSVAHLRSP